VYLESKKEGEVGVFAFASPCPGLVGFAGSDVMDLLPAPYAPCWYTPCLQPPPGAMAREAPPDLLRLRPRAI
jgi:hypothetical protein